MLPTRSNSSSAFCGVIWVTTQSAPLAAFSVQKPSTMPSRISIGLRARISSSVRSLYSQRSTFTSPAEVMYVCALRSTRRCALPSITIASASTSWAAITSATMSRSNSSIRR